MGKWDYLPNHPGAPRTPRQALRGEPPKVTNEAPVGPVPLCRLKGCSIPVPIPRRGKVPGYCSPAHKQAAFRALKKELDP